MIKIYRNTDGLINKVCEVSSKDAVHRTAIMGAYEVHVNVTVASALDIQEGDFITIDSINYTLNRDAECTIESDVNMTYEMVFEHPFYRLLDKLYTERMSGSSTFFLTGRLQDFVEMIVWNINKTEQNELGVDTGWSVGFIEETDYRNLSFVDINCKEALDQLAEEFEVEYRFENKTIIFEERIERLTDYMLEVGVNKGLYSVTQQNVDKEDTVTRLYVRGGNQNVLSDHTDEEGYLKIPENFLEDFSQHSKVVERKVKFEDEFPKFIGEVATVEGDVNESITCPEIDFDIQQLAIGDNARINFLSGDLMGISFQFAWHYSEKKIVLVPQEDETASVNANGEKPSVPNILRRPEVGDKFNFTGILMPQSYIDASISRLRARGRKRLDFFSKKRVKYSANIDHRYLRGKPTLQVGDLVVLFVPQKGLLDAIRITQLDKNLHTGAIEATISNYLEHDWGKYIEGRINAVKSQILSGQTGVKVVDGVIYRDRGIWSLITAQTNPYLRTAKINDLVWHKGHKWLCMKNGTTEEPSFSSNDWRMVEGSSEERMEIFSSNGLSFAAGFVDTVFTPKVFIGNINVTDEIPLENWKWERITINTTSDLMWNAQHTSTKTVHITGADMGTHWSRQNPVTFVCTAIYPKTLQTISYYIEF